MAATVGGGVRVRTRQMATSHKEGGMRAVVVELWSTADDDVADGRDMRLREARATGEWVIAAARLPPLAVVVVVVVVVADVVVVRCMAQDFNVWGGSGVLC